MSHFSDALKRAEAERAAAPFESPTPVSASSPTPTPVIEPVPAAAPTVPAVDTAPVAVVADAPRPAISLSERIPRDSVEQYRRCAALLHHTQAARGAKVVLIASALPKEGKTVTAVNLAITFSESYRRQVLLIDADLRRPTLHEFFNLPNVAGLNDGLKAKAEEKLHVSQVTPNLSILTAGRPDPDPMSGLTSPRMKWILGAAAARFDWVIIDSPPVWLLPAANLLAAMVDVAVVVIGAGTTPCERVQHAVEALGRERVIGAVLNRVKSRRMRHDYEEAYVRDQAIAS